MTTGETSSATPHPHDYWAQPERAGQAEHSLGLLQEYERRFTASLEPIADAFAAQEAAIPSGGVELQPPRGYKQFGLENPALAAHLILDSQIKHKTGGERFLAIVRPEYFEDYGLQGRSMTFACGKQTDERSPGEYAPVALAMPMDYYARGYWAQWLARLPAAVLEERAAAAAAARRDRDRIESLKSRAAAVDLAARTALLHKIIAVAGERTDPGRLEGWNRAAAEVSDEVLIMRALDTQSEDVYASVARNLAEVRERAAAGLLPGWEKLFFAAAVVMNDEELREL